MKFKKKKPASPNTSGSRSAPPAPDRSFYSQYAGEPPLDESADYTATQQDRRTSLHNRTDRLKKSNRASNWSLFILISRALLVIVLLAGGFLLLRAVTGRLNEPSEKEKQRWDASEVRMSGAVLSGGEPGSSFTAITPEWIRQRLEQWEQAGHRLRTVETLSRRGIYEDAAVRLKEILAMMPENREALRILAGIHMRAGRYAEAIPLYIRLLDQDDRQPELKMNLLQALDADGQTDSALALAEKLLTEQPDHLTVLSIAAAGQFEQGNKNAALALFQKIVEKNPADIPALHGCGRIHFERQEWSSAVPYYLELSRIDPKPAWYYQLARCFAQQNETGKSVVFMGQAASLFGSAEIKPWLTDSGFDPVRESSEFRSFADWVVGIETRKAIEAINRREAKEVKPLEDLPAGLDIPKQPELQVIRPGQ